MEITPIKGKTKMRMTKKEKLAEIDRILKLKGAKRWRAVADLTLATNARVRKQHEKLLKEVEELRATRYNDNGSSPNSRNFRLGASIPEGVWKALVGFDMLADGTSKLYDSKKDHNDPMATNKIVRDLAKAFPEYRVYKNITPTKEGYRANNN